MNRLKFTGIIFATSIFSGCFSTSFLYNNADWYVQGKIDDHFAITELQEQQLNLDIKAFFDWHRSQELPEYAVAIDNFNKQFADGLTKEELSDFLDTMNAARVRAIEANLTAASSFLAGIDEAQIQHYDDEFQDDLEEDKERAEQTDEEQKDRRYQRLLENLEDWFGLFDEEQKKSLRVISDSRVYDRKLRMKESIKKHENLMTFLRSKPKDTVIKDYLQTNYSDPYKQNTDALSQLRRQRWLDIMLKIDKIIKKDQRQTAIDKLNGYKNDFLELSSKKIK